MFVCKACFALYEEYIGQCSSCGRWHTLVDKQSSAGKELPVRASEGAKDIATLRQTDLKAVNHALGGFAPGGVYLLGGERGSGKSTLAMQIAACVGPSIYITAEEPIEQVCARGVRLGCGDVPVVATTDFERVLVLADSVRGGLCVVDSLQKVTRGKIEESKEAVEKICDFAHGQNVTLLLISHVTKNDEIAGSRKIEHDVDVVAMLKPFGGAAQVLKAIKNRFGPSDISGWLRMGPSGLYDSGPEVIFPEKLLSGRILTVDRDGMPREVQARKVSQGQGMVLGLSSERARLVTSILECGSSRDFFLRGDGDSLDGDEGADIAIAAAIQSTLDERPISEHACVWGQLSLDGRVLSSEEELLRADSARDMGLEIYTGKTVWDILRKLGLGKGAPWS